MDILGFVIGTAISWVLTYGVTVPLARSFAGEANITAPAGETEDKPDAIDLIPSSPFIITHILVMGMAGFLLGAVFGIYFIGVAWKAKLWPGMIALILASLMAAGVGG